MHSAGTLGARHAPAQSLQRTEAARSAISIVSMVVLPLARWLQYFAIGFPIAMR